MAPWRSGSRLSPSDRTGRDVAKVAARPARRPARLRAAGGTSQPSRPRCGRSARPSDVSNRVQQVLLTSDPDDPRGRAADVGRRGRDRGCRRRRYHSGRQPVDAGLDTSFGRIRLERDGGMWQRHYRPRIDDGMRRVWTGGATSEGTCGRRLHSLPCTGLRPGMRPAGDRTTMRAGLAGHRGVEREPRPGGGFGQCTADGFRDRARLR